VPRRKHQFRGEFRTALISLSKYKKMIDARGAEALHCVILSYLSVESPTLGVGFISDYPFLVVYLFYVFFQPPHIVYDILGYATVHSIHNIKKIRTRGDHSDPRFSTF
jgi:hypothetical protein